MEGLDRPADPADAAPLHHFVRTEYNPDQKSENDQKKPADKVNDFFNPPSAARLRLTVLDGLFKFVHMNTTVRAKNLISRGINRDGSSAAQEPAGGGGEVNNALIPPDKLARP